MEVLTQMWAQVKKGWEGMTSAQRALGVALVGLMVAALVGGALWGGRVEYVSLFEKRLESADQVGSVLRTLQAAGIEVRQEKGQIQVPAAQYDRAFMELSGKSAWPQDQTTLDLKGLADDWKLSDGARKERARLSLQARLGRMLAMMQGVQSANVLLAEGNNTPFSGERFDPKASVQIALKEGVEALSPGVAETIRRVVAFGVQGVKPESVSVVDSLGRIYEARPTDETQVAMSDLDHLRRTREEELKRTIYNALAPIAGPRIAVAVSVVLNQDRVTAHEVKVNPDEVLVQDEKTESRSSTGTSAEEGGVPGVSSNLNERPAVNAVAGPTSTSTEKKTEIHRVSTHSETQTVKGIGDVKQVTVGVLVPYAKAAPAPEAKTLDEYRRFAMAAAGLTDAQFVTVAGLPYDPAPVAAPDRLQDILGTASAHADQIILAVLAVGALLILGRALRSGAPVPVRGGGEEVETGKAAALAAIRKAQAEPLPEMTPESQRFADMEQRVRDMVRKDPRVSAGLVKRWLMTTK